MLSGTDRPLVIASGTATLAPGHVATERDGLDEEPPREGPQARAATTHVALSLATRGVRSCVLRLPPTVHGEGDSGFIPILIGIARTRNVSGYIADGSHRWPAVHRLDAAHLFRLALENAPAGTVLHGTADEGVPIRAVAEVIGRHLDLPTTAISSDDAEEHFGWLGGLLGTDMPASSALTHDLLAWHPTRPDLLTDLDKGHYFHP